MTSREYPSNDTSWEAAFGGPKRKAVALTALALGTAVVVGKNNPKSAEAPKQPTPIEAFAQSHGMNVAKEYTVRAGDTAWTIQQKAKLGGDPRKFTYELNKTIPNDASHKEKYLQPGDQILLDDDAKIGKEVAVDPELTIPNLVDQADLAKIVPSPPSGKKS